MLRLNFSQKIFKYIKKFGLMTGTRLFFEIRKTKKKGIIEFKIPGLKFPIFLRRDSSDYDVFEEVFIANQYKIPTSTKPAYIIDAGANIGLTALYFLRLYPEAKIICIEPEAANYEILLENTVNYKSIVCLKKALWNKSTRLQIKDLKADSWAFEIVDVDGVGENLLDATTINEILSEHNFSRIDILKIDIEGSEKEVFEANTEWVNKVDCIVVEIHDDIRKGAYESVISLMSANKFNLISATPLYIFRR